LSTTSQGRNILLLGLLIDPEDGDVNSYRNARRHIPEDSTVYSRRCEELISSITIRRCQKIIQLKVKQRKLKIFYSLQKKVVD
jgi:hypothetical protein